MWQWGAWITGGRITVEDGGRKGQRREPMGFSEHTSVAYNSFPTLGLTNNARLVIFSENNYHGT
jgi:hypothetical protein